MDSDQDPEIEEDFEDCRVNGRYYNSDYNSIWFDVVPLTEGGKEGYPRMHRVSIQEPDIWFYLWPWHRRD